LAGVAFLRREDILMESSIHGQRLTKKEEKSSLKNITLT
jgi:hypothetical protein